jgi:hypothetical protein
MKARDGSSSTAHGRASKLTRASGLIAMLAILVGLMLGASIAAAGEWSSATMLDTWWAVESVSCASSSNCVAVGTPVFEDEPALGSAYNGVSWAMGAEVPGTAQLHGVSCPSTSRCVAVGGEDAVSRNSGKWEGVEVVDPTGHLLSASCGNEAFCAATDEEGNAVIYKTGKWGAVEHVDGSTAIQAVSCAGEFCAAVDAGGGALIYSAGKWNTPEPADAHALTSVSCPSTGFCIAVDNSGNALTYTGGKWGTPASIGGTAHLLSVSCATETLCIASAEGQGTLVDSGGTWTLGTTIEGPTSCVAASTFCTVTERDGYTSSYAGGTWTTPEDFGGEFGNVSCTPSSYCLATDETGHALVYSGGGWTARTPVFDGGYGPRPVACVSASLCVAANGEHLVQFNGSKWTTVAGTTDPSKLVSISCASEALCVAGDTAGNYLVDHDGVWSSTPASSGDGGHPLEAISCSTDTFCMAVNEPGETLTYNGSGWSAREATHVGLLLGNGQNQLSCAPGTHFCAAPAEAGKAVMTYRKGAWGPPVGIGGKEGWNLVSCTSEVSCVIESPDGRFTSTYDGTSWSAPQALPGTENGGPWALSCGSQRLCVLLEENGRALVYTDATPGAPANTSPPTITGTTEEGQTLTEHHGGWTNTPTEYSVQWERCNASGGGCTTVASGGTSFALTSADVGSTVRVVEVASNGAGASTPVESEHTAIVTAVSPGGGPPASSGGSPGSGGGGSSTTASTAQVTLLNGEPPQPVVGQRQTVAPAGGTVTIRLAGSSRFVALSSTTSIPNGSEVDATNGHVAVTVATPAGTKTAEVYGGRFIVRQDRSGSDETHFVLSLALSGCPRVALPRGPAAVAAAHTKRGPKSRYLWVSEQGGSWGTTGRYVSTTVQGTRWLTQDECNQSQVRVATGKVKVLDLVRNKTKNLSTGQHYTAASRKGRA